MQNLLNHNIKEKYTYGTQKPKTKDFYNLLTHHFFYFLFSTFITYLLKEHFYQVQPKAKNIDYGDISSRVALREELKCKSFKWYLHTVYPEMRTPNDTKGRTGGVVEGGGGMQRMQRKAPQTSLRKGKVCSTYQ